VKRALVCVTSAQLINLVSIPSTTTWGKTASLDLKSDTLSPTFLGKTVRAGWRWFGGFDSWGDMQGMYKGIYGLHIISNWAFQFPEVSQPRQPLKTAENLKTWRLGNLCLFFRKPHGGIRCENLWNLQKPVKPWKFLLQYIYSTSYISSIYMYIISKVVWCMLIYPAAVHRPCGHVCAQVEPLPWQQTMPKTIWQQPLPPSMFNVHPPPLEASLDYNVAHLLHRHS